jgi:Na+/H+-dicarboxylate symporter
MRRIRLHWWVLAGILAGALWGTWLNRAHYTRIHEHVVREIRKTVPDWPEDAETIHARRIQENVEKEFRELPAGAAAFGIAALFLALLKMIVVPLVFTSLVCGVLGIGDFRRLGRLGGKTLAWYLSTTTIAIVTGLLLVQWIRPGEGVRIVLPASATGEHPPKPTVWERIVAIVPENPVGALAKGDMLPIIFFAILFGIFALLVREERRRALAAFFEAAFEVMMKMTLFVIALAPVGIAALIARLVATTGPQVFAHLLGYALTVAAGLAIHFFVTLPFLCWVITRRNPYRVMRAMAPALLTAFSTASSSGTLPVTMERAERGVGVSNKVSSFVLPLGATVNMDGTALYECVATLFVAQLYAAADPTFTLTAGDQIAIVFLALLVSIGAAGIPQAGLIMMVIIFEAVRLPVGLTALLWAVDRPLDMCRTTVNVWSDVMGAVTVAHTEGEIDESVLFA